MASSVCEDGLDVNFPNNRSLKTGGYMPRCKKASQFQEARWVFPEKSKPECAQVLIAGLQAKEPFRPSEVPSISEVRAALSGVRHLRASSAGTRSATRERPRGHGNSIF